MEISGLDSRSEWIRLRTLTLLRWFALLGQSAAVAVAALVLGFDLPIGALSLAIGASVVVNLASAYLWPISSRLTAGTALGLMLFDTAQLVVLLALTGGLSNPFVMLILAPVAIGAAMLNRRGVVTLVLASMLLLSTLWFCYVPLRTTTGETLELSGIFRLGTWIAVEISILFLSLYARRIQNEMHVMSNALVATQTALAREQKLTDIGGVVAAAAHELGTPLGTISLAASELAELLADQPELAEDANLIRTQARRCKEILNSMGTIGKDDKLMRHALARSVVEEAAAPHQDRGARIHIVAQASGPDSAEPEIPRAPEIIHGLRNLIQNAVDHASAEVTVRVQWTPAELSVHVCDDGPGFPATLIDRLGEPLQHRGRQPHEGMGLGLFISKTLLERTGAALEFSNGTGVNEGARIYVTWPRARIETHKSRSALGANPLNQRDGLGLTGS